MRITQEEIFGPVLVATPFDEFDDVIKAANNVNTRYGLGAGVFTSDVSKAHKVASRLQSGNVWINCYATVDPQCARFGRAACNASSCSERATSSSIKFRQRQENYNSKSNCIGGSRERSQWRSFTFVQLQANDTHRAASGR